MFQVRFVLLAMLIPLAGVAALLAGTGALYNTAMPPFESGNGAAAQSAAGVMAEFASATVDAAARASSDGDVRTSITTSTLTPKVESVLLASAGGRFGPPSFALLVGIDGSVVGRIGVPSKLPDALSGFPVVAEALTGVARDGVWIEDGAPVHLAAAAVYEGASPVGCVVLGWPFSDAMVASVFKRVSAPVVVTAMSGTKVFGPVPDGVDAASLSQRIPFGEIVAGPGPFPILLPDRTRYLLTAVPLYPGESQFALEVITDRNEAFASLGEIQAGVVVASLILTVLVLLIIFSTIRGMNRPLELITEHLSQVQQGNNVGILPEAGLGQMLRLGKQINMILQSLPSSRPGTAPLFGSSTSQDIPAPSPSSSFGAGVGFDQGSGPSAPAPNFFADDAKNSRNFSSPPAPTPAPAPTAPPSAMSNPPSPTPPPAMSTSTPPENASAPPSLSAPPSAGLVGLFDEGPDPLAAFRVPSTAPAAPPAAPPPAPEPAVDEMRPEATVMFQVPESLLAASASPTPSAPPAPAAPPPARSAPVDDNRTVVAQVPQELLAQVAPRNDLDAADDLHYKEVYEKFVQTRIECGEDTAELSFDRFVAKLLKNRQQIVEKHKAKSVRFQVYVKDGKAALRALPVRE